ncbi:hypothetical protein [Spiroplasma cantharicola]|uniref:Uncharacterized protein n=1 Tax=Spiroplasma cantharicola TaxID=362837 RepID=A0A0M3SJB7_9MOLU|nr:hypothetical protein [Spiroplasma cantharicola]ALD66454.1 hypothetical protein SCANT_v1c05480 [Spiroplasma cantharicola]
MFEFTLVDIISLITGIISLILATFISIWIYKKDDFKDFYREFKEKYFFTFNKNFLKEINSYLNISEKNNDEIDSIENHLNKILYFLSFLIENKKTIKSIYNKYKKHIKSHLKKMKINSSSSKANKSSKQISLNKIPDTEMEFLANFKDKKINEIFNNYNKIYNNLFSVFIDKTIKKEKIEETMEALSFLSKAEPDIILTILWIFKLSKAVSD